jgi:hypothetical protein
MIRPILLTAVATVFLAACQTDANQAGSPTATAPQQRQQVAAVSESDPGPGACGADISAFRRIMKQDIDMGHVGKTVYDQITNDLEVAAGACRAGRDGEARSMVAATKARHGYRQ